ncbi:hypothetical protein GLOTRDRAFT_92259 [Gloeophyllum trabeum ATCC 11539]|uniref:Uncharacterized protein n=1 Tax=Gloeophyllum trabeum (strain ATCC 11539 / FP-39264 / Madison 617) TaxID=670483 RepID=S7RR76_GLOTA|nr:uncharacterized protein GLOTRDRAFT_92259 [Gloeophyllum trabeum ATCC 11539]EPQ57120.1 hypothetical protein GLOTRDRAFT_92259 [Gloeophyllum trabeum ATCC 11539]
MEAAAIVGTVGTVLALAQTRPVWTKVTADSILQKVDKYRREGAQEVYDNKEIIDQVTLLDLIERHRYLAWQHDLLKSRNTQIWHVKEMYRCIKLLRITKGFRNDALRSSEYAKNNALGQYCALRTRAEESSAVPLAEALEVLDNQATTSRRRVEDLSSVLSTRSGSSTFVNSSDPARGTGSDTAGTLTQSDVQELDRALDQFENSVVQYGALLDQASAMLPTSSGEDLQSGQASLQYQDQCLQYRSSVNSFLSTGSGGYYQALQHDAEGRDGA